MNLPIITQALFDVKRSMKLVYQPAYFSQRNQEWVHGPLFEFEEDANNYWEGKHRLYTRKLAMFQDLAEAKERKAVDEAARALKKLTNHEKKLLGL